MSNYTRTNPLLKIYSGLAAMTLIALITVTLSFLAVLAVPEARRVIHVTPGAVVIVLSLDQALDLSLALGDGRRVNWEEVA